jgi:hypothetical protein
MLAKRKETEMKRGTADEAEELIDVFGRYRLERAVLVAPHPHD